MNRICKKCGEEKDIDQFKKVSGCTKGRSHTCKRCCNKINIKRGREQTKDKLAHNKDYQKEYQRRYRREHQQGGIYKIQSKLFPDKIYIGSSKKLSYRFYWHKESLSDNNFFFNSITLIQNHVNKYGINDLEFSIIKLCPIDALIYWEQYFISELNPYFNTHRFASGHDINATVAKQSALDDMRQEDRYGAASIIQEKNILSICDRHIFPEELISL